jgi:hypothetical protein
MTEKKSPATDVDVVTRSPAIDVAKGKVEVGEIHTLSTGVRARLVPVAANLITDAQMRVKDPPVPWIKDEAKGQEYENPQDPEYIRKCEEAQMKRLQAGIDVMILFGVELVDGLPEDEGWLNKLRYAEKLGHLDLSAYDLDDELERRFIYKRYVAVASRDYIEIGKLSGVGREEVKAALDSFPGDEARSTD